MAIEDQTIREFMEALAAKQPTPGGGAVASIVAALAAALGRMVVNYSVGKKALIEFDALHRAAIDNLREHGSRALELADDDARAYERLNTLMKLDANDPKRQQEFSAAVEEAINAPHAVLHVCLETLRLLQGLAGKTNKMLASDLAIAALLAEAGARAAAWNVRINLPLLDDELMRSTFERTIERTLSDASQIAREVETACGSST